MFQFQFLYINPPKAYIVQQQKVREAFTSLLIAVSPVALHSNSDGVNHTAAFSMGKLVLLNG